MSEETTELSFVKRDDISETFDANLKNHFNKLSVTFSTTFNPSHITECPRRIIYRCNGVKPEFSITQREADAEKDLLLKLAIVFRSCKGIKFHNDNLLVSDCNYNIVGNLDFVIGIKETLLATKIYSVENEMFQKIQEKGAIKKDVIEVMVYMWLIELNDGLIVYENRSSLDHISFHIKPYKPIIKSVIKKCRKLVEHEMNGTIPDRPYKTKENSECCRCEYEVKCWGK